MKLFYKLLLITLSTTFLNCSSENDKRLKIIGTVVNSDTESILLLKPNQDMRFDSIIEIPVTNGAFHFETKLEHPEAVTLMLGEAKNNGGGRYMPLFLENQNIKLAIHSEDEFDKNSVQGGKLNTEYQKYKKKLKLKFNDRLKPLQDSINMLFEQDKFYSSEMKKVLSKLRKAKSQNEKIVLYESMEELKEKKLDKTPEARILRSKIEKIYREQKKYQQEYIDKNPSIVSYSFLLNNLIFQEEAIDVGLAKRNYEKLSQAHPNHPYNKLASNLIAAIDNIKIGKKYIDFAAPDLNGNSITLSDEISGKVALLDLWATWCGPCIAKSRTMVPIYKEFRDKGFTIVGVAGEFKNTNRLKTFLEKEKWPWLNLVELDRKNQIWQKYGVDGGGGGIFLIDKEGKIIAIDPTAEEVRNELVSRLN